VNDGDASAMFIPADEFKITYEIDFKHPVIGKQSYRMTFSDEKYEKEICAAQTFGFLKDLEFLQAKGLALGGSLKNAIVLDDSKIINKEGQRIENVFVKHKILDAIGDLFLLGMPIIGHFIAYKSGHRLNNLLLKELMNKKDCWEIVNCINKEEVHKLNSFKKIPSFRILDAIQA
jgi:UDP-3-O-[3-hydroxymyristoyl] N-acetylglucosamine deacetylase